MSLEFFKEYPQLDYDLYSNGSSIRITDIFRAVAANISSLPSDASAYTYYEIFDGDRPDIVSHKLYDTPKYYWTFFILNERLRNGLNAEWPLSQSDFSRYVDREYGNYSVISILPQIDINGKGIMDMTIIPFSEKYLKHLSIVKYISLDDYMIGNIHGYDYNRCQLIVKNIHRRANGNRIEIARESFVEDSKRNSNKSYNFYWDNYSIDKMPEDTAEQRLAKESAYKDSLALKEEWISIVYNQLLKPEVDYYGWKSHKESFISPEKYVFGKAVIPADNNFRWSYYFNAAHTYYDVGRTRIKNAYEILTDYNIVNPTYKSFNEYENEKNDEKRKLKIIRPDWIVEFSSSYFETLNNA